MDDDMTDARTLATIDDALAPAVRHAQGIGTASLSDLGVILRCVRQAMAAIVYGPPALTASASDPGPETDAAEAAVEAAFSDDTQPHEPAPAADPLS